MDATQRGFALPSTVFALAILALLSGTGFFLSWIDLQASRALDAGARAHFAADAGLAMALSRAGRPASGLEGLDFGHATALLSFEPLIELPGRGALFAVESVGAVVERGTPVRRTVGRTMWASGPPRFSAALGAGGAIVTGAATGYITGHPPGGCPGPSGAAIAAWGPVDTGTLTVLGAPAVTIPSASTTPMTETGLRWPDLISGAVAPPDATIPPDGWPSPSAPQSYVRLTTAGPLGPGQAGQGALIADGDLDLADGFSWTGLILVGGSLRMLGDVSIRGAVFAGLDPSQPSTVDLGDGAVALEFDPCAADQAAHRLAPFAAAIPGTWYERW